MTSDDDEAVRELTELLDGIEERVESTRRVAVLDERNRLNLLFGHAIFAMMVAPGFALLYHTGMASASFTVARRIPGAPFSLAAWIFAGGLMLAVTTYHRYRTGEYAALAVLLAWYLMFSISLIAAVAVWLTAAIVAGGLTGFSEHLDWSHAPAIYAPVVYMHLAYAMGGHMRTIRKLGLRGHGDPR
jgi:uncharacterized membrane protein YhdT